MTSEYTPKSGMSQAESTPKSGYSKAILTPKLGIRGANDTKIHDCRPFFNPRSPAGIPQRARLGQRAELANRPVAFPMREAHVQNVDITRKGL
jgi:hypothetical protein